jgi:ubiquinone/menaquinone biosynthesis C-methylase UbiE
MLSRRSQTLSASERARKFYEAQDENRWGRDGIPDLEPSLLAWVERANPAPNRILVELGAGRGAFRHFSRFGTYVGIDLSHEVLRRYVRPPCALQANIEAVPLKSRSVDFVFSIATLEHVPNPERVLEEVHRVLKPQGMAFLAPAWFCRPWAAEGLPVRPFRELNFANKVRKALIPLRNSVLWRSAFVIPRRLFREVQFRCACSEWRIWYRRLRPNLEEYIYTDCDAFSSLDPHEVVLFFLRRGYEIVSASSLIARVLLPSRPVVVRKIGSIE